MMAMKTGFGRVNLRTSSLAAGGISFMMVLTTIAVQRLFFWSNYLDRNLNEAQMTVIAKSYYVSCAVAVILWSTVLCLWYGAYKKKHRAFLIPYLIAFGILVPVNVAFIIYVFLYEEVWVTALFPIICVPLTCYCLCVVASYYIQLHLNNRQEFQIQATIS